MSFEIGQKVAVCWSRYKRVMSENTPSTSWGMVGQVIKKYPANPIHPRAIIQYHVVFNNLPLKWYYEDCLVAVD